MNRLVGSSQFTRGKTHEAELDEFFRQRGFDISYTTPEQERRLHLGDRVFRKDGRKYFIEYKSDESTSRTGNVFIETISVDTSNIPGWAYTCRADFIFYYLPPEGLICVISPDRLREQILIWKTEYPERSTNKGQNNNYKTHGLLVPVQKFRQACKQTISTG